jgi:transposase
MTAQNLEGELSTGDFLKRLNPMYFADAFFLKNRKRVVALVTIMTIALLIFSLLQRKLRLLLEAKSETVPNQKKRPTKKPTMNWVNLCFDGVDVIREQIGRKYGYTFVRADEFVRKVLKILGPGYEHRYSEQFLDSPAC